MLRDRKYLDWLRTQRCILCGLHGHDYDVVDPCHIGTAGKGIKSPDNEALPIRHMFHQEMHSKGEISTLRRLLPDDVLRLALRAYAREMYREWKDG
jgi:hypothetical protein